MPAPTPQDMFGFGSVPLTSYFKKPAGASSDTRFSPMARAMFQQEERMAREQGEEKRRLEAEALANQLLGQAPNMTQEQLDQAILNTPQVFGSGLQGLTNYSRYRQQVAPSQSDEVLGPALLKKITDPRHAARFQDRMLRERFSANDAWDAYRTDEHNEKYAVQLAEAGVPEEEFQSLQVGGMLDPVAVTRKVSEAKRLSGTGRGEQEVDRQLARVDKLIDLERKRVEEGDTGYEKDKKTGRFKYPELVTLEDDYKKLARLSLLSKEERESLLKAEKEKAAAEAAASAAPVTATKATAPAQDRMPEDIVLPEQREFQKAKKAAEEAKKTQEEAVIQRIGSSWTQAKGNVEKNLLNLYRPEDLDVVAQAIAEGRAAPIEAGAQLEGDTVERYTDFILRGMGLDPVGVAFREPENRRWPTQNVSNQELLEVWAKERMKDVAARKKVSKAATDLVPKGKTPSGAVWISR